MAFVRKHFVWLILGAVLVGEGVFAFMLFREKAHARAQIKQLTGKREDRNRRIQQNPAEANVMRALARRRKATERERGDDLLCMWHAARRLERLFGKHDKVSIRPWNPLSRGEMGAFKSSYQFSYNAAVDAIGKDLAALNATREQIGLAAQRDFVEKAEITIGDIFTAQQDFRITRDIVLAAHATGMYGLGKLEFEREGEKERRPRGPGAPKEKGRYFDRIRVEFPVYCQYRDLAGFLEELQSPRLDRFRKGAEPPVDITIRSVRSVERYTSKRAEGRGDASTGGRRVAPVDEYGPPVPPTRPRPRERPTGPRETGPPLRPGERRGVPPLRPGERTGVPPETAEPPPEPMAGLVEAVLVCEVLDYNVGIYQIAFKEAAGFKTKADVAAWAENHLQAVRNDLQTIDERRSRLIDREAKEHKGAKKPVPRPTRDRAWITPADAAWVSKAMQTIEEFKESSKGKDQGFTITAYTGSVHERHYKFTEPEAALKWLRQAAVYEERRLEAWQAFFQYVLDALKTEDPKKEGGALTLTFLDKKYFDDGKALDLSLYRDLKLPAEDPKARGQKTSPPDSVVIKFRLITFRPDTGRASRR